MVTIKKETVEEVLRLTESVTGISRQKMFARTRDRDSCHARAIVAYHLYNDLGLTFQDIGDIMGNREPNTIYYLVQIYRQERGCYFRLCATRIAAMLLQKLKQQYGYER